MKKLIAKAAATQQEQQQPNKSNTSAAVVPSCHQPAAGNRQPATGTSSNRDKNKTEKTA